MPYPRQSYRAATLAGALIALVCWAPEAVSAPAAAAAIAAAGPQRGPYQIGFESSGLGLTARDVEISSRNVYDYTFASAPTDWVPRGGTWVMQSRWTCSPQWSWYGGYGDTIAALWNKRVFEGDVSVNLHAAFKMGLGSFSGYKNPNDMNITLLGDGANPDSGYSFIVGGGLNMFTRIMKGDTVLAETREPACLLPIFEDGAYNTTAFHRRWWILKAERIGDVLSLYIDNRLALQAHDPDPIPSGHVGIWTHDNGIVIARVRISYEREMTASQPAPVPRYVAADDPTQPDARAFVTSRTHPGVFIDFETGLDQFAPRSAADGAALDIVERGPDGRARALKLVNANAGGDFAATAVSQPLTVGPRGVKYIDFDYKVGPDARVNLFAKVEGGLYEIVFTGPDEPSYMTQILGAIEGAKADNRWHRAHFDLWAHLRRVFGDVDALALDDLFFANRNTGGYLTAGFGGNRAGATWYLDNFYMGTAGPASVELSWRPTRGRPGQPPIVSYATALDGNPHTIPSAKDASPETQLSCEGLAPGTHFFHLRPQLVDGSSAPVIHHKIIVDAKAPTVVAVHPQPGTESHADDISVELTDGSGVGVDPKSLILAVDGTEYRIADEVVRYDAVTRRLSFASHEAGLSFADGQTVGLELAAASDYLGHAIADAPKWSFTMSHAADHTPPPAPTVAGPTDYLCNDTFERDMGEWANYGSAKGAIVCRDSSTAASGTYSLKLYNRTNGGLFGAYIRKTPFDAGKYRIVSFDYKINDRIRADFAVYVNGKWRNIVFTDNDNNLGKIGEVPGVIRDNEWHHAEFDLYDMLCRAAPEAGGYVVRHFIIGDWGTMANTQHATYWIDNFRIMPIVPASENVSFNWDSRDPSGILGASWIFDRRPDTVPPERISGTSTEPSFAELSGGAAYFHVRAADGAGNWSATTHYRVLVDSIRPTIGPHRPAPAVVEAHSRIEIPLADAGGAGMDPGSIVLSVGGVKYGVTNPGLTYDAARELLVWDGQHVSPKPVVFADGQRIDVALESAADYAGNLPAELPRWSWTMDYSKDSSPPVVELVKCTTHPTAVTDTFEHDLGEWAPGPGGAQTRVERDRATAASGSFSARITRGGGSLSVAATGTEYDALRHPIVSFDYKVPPGLKVDMRVRMAGNWHTVAFTGDPARGEPQIPKVQADGRWHHASFNLMTYLRPRARRVPRLTIEQIVFGDRPPYKNRPGASFSIDNFIIGAPGRAAPAFSWKASDATGVVDYSYVLDDRPETVPDEVGEGPAAGKRFASLRGGLYFFHIRAKDGAGHWGPARHYAVMHLSPPPTR